MSDKTGTRQALAKFYWVCLECPRKSRKYFRYRNEAVYSAAQYHGEHKTDVRIQWLFQGR